MHTAKDLLLASDQTAINKALNLTDTDRFRHRYVE